MAKKTFEQRKPLNLYDKLLMIPMLIFGLSIIVLFSYLIINNFSWKIALVIIIAIATLLALSFLLSSLERFFETKYKGHPNEKEKKDTAMTYVGVSLVALICLIVTFFVWKGLIQEINKKASYKKIPNKEIMEQLKKSKEEINSAVISIDASINTLIESKDKIDGIISQAATNKDVFIKQIAKLNEAEEIAQKLDTEAKENEKILDSIKTALAGKKVLTIEEFEKNKWRDLIIAFFLGIVSSLVASLIITIFKLKNKTQQEV